MEKGLILDNHILEDIIKYYTGKYKLTNITPKCVMITMKISENKK